MPPVDPSLTAPVIAQWGAFGVILIVLVIVCGVLGRALLKSYLDRIAETRDMLTSTLKAANDGTQALKDMNATVVSLGRTFDQAVDLLKGGKS